MAIGERIHFFRTMRGMTQKYLGMALGFPEKSADVRLAQYENGSRTPKADVTAALAQVLDVSPKALDVPDIDSYGILKETMAVVMEKIQFYLDHRSYEQILLGAVVFSNVYGLLGQTRDAEELIHKIQEQAVGVNDIS